MKPALKRTTSGFRDKLRAVRTRPPTQAGRPGARLARRSRRPPSPPWPLLRLRSDRVHLGLGGGDPRLLLGRNAALRLGDPDRRKFHRGRAAFLDELRCLPALGPDSCCDEGVANRISIAGTADEGRNYGGTKCGRDAPSRRASRLGRLSLLRAALGRTYASSGSALHI